MNRKNISLLTDDLVKIENSRLRFETPGKLPNIVEEFGDYTLNQKTKPERCQHVSGWTWKH
jgi:hypothetical protein